MEKTKIIAEIGVNHNGDLSLAKEMISAASESGADIVKFQTHIPDQEMISNISDHISVFNNLYSHIEKLSFTFDEMLSLKQYSEKSNVKFLSTPFSEMAVEWMEKMGVDMYKIGSGETQDFILLKRVISTGKKIIVSTGLSSLNEISSTVNFLKRNKSNFILMQCTSIYPCPYDKINLRCIKTMQDMYNCDVGFSDHSDSKYIPVAAVAMGAVVIEKHFTVDRSLPGTDQAGSMLPSEFMEMVIGIRSVEQSMGDGVKNKYENSDIKKIFEHGIVSKTDIKSGDIVSLSNITSKRPLCGIPSRLYEEIIGKRFVVDINADVPINYDMISKD